MKKLVCVIAIIIINTSCQTLSLKENTFIVSDSNVELGAMGKLKSSIGMKSNFSTYAYPKIEGKIKLELSIVPFTEKANKLYQAKAIYNQQQEKINYMDSLPVKPEMVSVKILDRAALVAELNTENNAKEFKYIQNNKATSIVTSILISLSNIEIARVRQADTYYLIQTDVAKYNIALYKLGKKVELLDISNSTVLGYNVGEFCWFENDRGKWQIGDIIEKGSCQGNTHKNVKRTKEKSLYNM